MDTQGQPVLSRLAANPLLRLMIAGFLGFIIVILLFLLMKFLITGPGDSGSGVLYRLFTLDTVTLPGEAQQRQRPQRPEYIEQLPEAPVFSDAEIKEEALEFLSSQSIEELEELDQPQPSTRDDLRKKREEMISILEEE